MYIIISWWHDQIDSAEVVKHLDHEEHLTMVFPTKEEALEYANKSLNWNWMVAKVEDRKVI
jgi:hypothetical protein